MSDVKFVDNVSLSWSNNTAIVEFFCRGQPVGAFALEESAWRHLQAVRPDAKAVENMLRTLVQRKSRTEEQAGKAAEDGPGAGGK
jgi:hypothetical protein